MRKRTTLRCIKEASECRRGRSRTPVHPASVVAWQESGKPVSAATIEADVRGARLLLPWKVQRGDTVIVSFANSLGIHQTRKAKIAWSEPLQNSSRFVAGMAFDEDLAVAV